VAAVAAHGDSGKFMADAQRVAVHYGALKRIGPPTYEPMWAILHGTGAYQEPRNGHYLTHVDAAALWDEVLRNRCTVRKS
jgi:hypothetical protein